MSSPFQAASVSSGIVMAGRLPRAAPAAGPTGRAAAGTPIPVDTGRYRPCRDRRRGTAAAGAAGWTVARGLRAPGVGGLDDRRGTAGAGLGAGVVRRVLRGG